MKPQSSPSKPLNPHAREYNPITPGVTPFISLAPPSSAAFPPPLTPLFLSPQIYTNYIPSISQATTNHPIYTNYPTFYPNPQNAVVTNPSPPAAQWRRGGFRGDIWRGRERCRSSRVENNVGRIKRHNYNYEKKRGGFWNMQKEEENRHKVMPLKLDDEEKTTVMIKNIPYNCPRKELISLLDDFCLIENTKAKDEGTSQAATKEHCNAFAYDFLYLPIDFRTEKSRGFAFVNFTTARAVWKFFECFHLRKWNFVEVDLWPKKIEIVCAKIQGKEALVKHFSESIFECEKDEFLPVSFTPPRNGSGESVELTVIGNRRGITCHRAARNNHYKA